MTDCKLIGKTYSKIMAEGQMKGLSVLIAVVVFSLAVYFSHTVFGATFFFGVTEPPTSVIEDTEGGLDGIYSENEGEPEGDGEDDNEPIDSGDDSEDTEEEAPIEEDEEEEEEEAPIEEDEEVDTPIEDGEDVLDPELKGRCGLDSRTGFTHQQYFDYTVENDNNATINEYLGDYTCVIIPAYIEESGTEYPVTYLGVNSFRPNQTGVYLTYIELPNSVIRIGVNSFRDNHLEELIIPDSVTRIWSHAFHNNRLERIEFPASVTSIWAHSFVDNFITEIRLPRSVEDLHNHAFDRDVLIIID